MVNSTEFAKRIEKILSFYGISATAFALAIDFNRSTISHIISGRNKPSLEFVMKVVNTYDEVELYWLLNGKGNFPPPEDSTQPISEIKKDKHLNPSITSSQNEALIRPDSSSNSKTAIDRIVIFYKDGSFKEYLP